MKYRGAINQAPWCWQALVSRKIKKKLEKNSALLRERNTARHISLCGNPRLIFFQSANPEAYASRHDGVTIEGPPKTPQNHTAENFDGFQTPNCASMMLSFMRQYTPDLCTNPSKIRENSLHEKKKRQLSTRHCNPSKVTHFCIYFDKNTSWKCEEKFTMIAMNNSNGSTEFLFIYQR